MTMLNRFPRALMDFLVGALAIATGVAVLAALGAVVLNASPWLAASAFNDPTLHSAPAWFRYTFAGFGTGVAALAFLSALQIIRAAGAVARTLVAEFK